MRPRPGFLRPQQHFSMNIKELQKEYANAGYGWLRAAFGSIVRRHFNDITSMTPDEKRAFIKAIGAPATYSSELSKELKTLEYDTLREKHATH